MFSFCTNVLLLYAKLIFYTYFRCDHFFSSYSFSIEKKRKEKKRLTFNHSRNSKSNLLK